MQRWVSVVALSASGVGLWFLWAHATDAWELRAPFNGTVLVMSAVAFVAAGAIGLHRALVLSPLLAAAPFLIEAATIARPPEAVNPADCDPSCGIPPEGMAMIVAVEVLILAGMGLALGLIWRSARRGWLRRGARRAKLT